MHNYRPLYEDTDMVQYHHHRASKPRDYRRVLFIIIFITGLVLIGAMFIQWDDLTLPARRAQASIDEKFLGPSFQDTKEQDSKGDGSRGGWNGGKVRKVIGENQGGLGAQLDPLDIKEKVKMFKEEIQRGFADPGDRESDRKYVDADALNQIRGEEPKLLKRPEEPEHQKQLGEPENQSLGEKPVLFGPQMKEVGPQNNELGPQKNELGPQGPVGQHQAPESENRKAPLELDYEEHRAQPENRKPLPELGYQRPALEPENQKQSLEDKTVQLEQTMNDPEGEASLNDTQAELPGNDSLTHETSDGSEDDPHGLRGRPPGMRPRFKGKGRRVDFGDFNEAREKGQDTELRARLDSLEKDPSKIGNLDVGLPGRSRGRPRELEDPRDGRAQKEGKNEAAEVETNWSMGRSKELDERTLRRPPMSNETSNGGNPSDAVGQADGVNGENGAAAGRVYDIPRPKAFQSTNQSDDVDLEEDVGLKDGESQNVLNTSAPARRFLSLDRPQKLEQRQYLDAPGRQEQSRDLGSAQNIDSPQNHDSLRKVDSPHNLDSSRNLDSPRNPDSPRNLEHTQRPEMVIQSTKQAPILKPVEIRSVNSEMKSNQEQGKQKVEASAGKQEEGSRKMSADGTTVNKEKQYQAAEDEKIKNNHQSIPEDKTAPQANVKSNQSSNLTKSTSKNYACTVPELDPWDKSLLKFLDHFETRICRRVQPNLMFIDNDNYLRYVGKAASPNFPYNNLFFARLNESELAAVNLTTNDVECVYMTIERADQEEDFQAHLGATRAFVKPIQLEKDLVQVNCVSKLDRSLLYGEVLAYPVPVSDKQLVNTSEEVLNVIMIFIDSLSLSAFRRHMPKTYQYLVKTMGFETMAGYNKIADNTFPNVIPMLTGKRVHNQQADMLDEFHEDVNLIYFDHWPLIWKNFSSKGYVTVFAEEFPDMGLFHIRGHGFRVKPVDHFYINYWKALEWMTYPKEATKGCYGNKTPAQILLDIVHKHLNRYRSQAQFMYAYLTYPAHSDSAQMEYLDQYYFEFFQNTNEMGLFNRSVVMFLSDHGHRDSAIRSTTVGLLEERLPVCMLYFPPWFYGKYPHLKENLKLNRDRLASNFDIHETLIDILQSNYGAQSKQRSWNSRGLSLLQPIPTNRTCKNAGIPLYFCTCQQMKWTKTDIGSSLAKYAAVDFVHALNEDVQKNQQCSRWTLKRLLAAEVMDISAEDAGVKSPTAGPAAAVIQADVYSTDLQLIRVTVEAEVAWVNGTFQALMLYSNREKQLSLHSDIGRLDNYGTQSLCIGTDANSQMKKLCVCRDYVMNGTIV